MYRRLWAFMLALGLSGCSQSPSPSPPPPPSNVPNTPGSSNSTNAEINELKFRITRLEQALKEPRTFGVQSVVISDDAIIGLINSGDVELVQAGSILARKQPSPSTQKALMALAISRDRPLDQRQTVLYALQNNHSPVLRSMWVELLADSNSDIVQRAAQAVQPGWEPDPVPALIHALGNIKSVDKIDQYNYARSTLMNALARMNDKRAIPSLLEGLRSPNESIRNVCLNGMAGVQDEAVREQIYVWFSNLREPPESTQEYISGIRLMKEFREPRAAKRILSWLEAGRGSIRSHAADALPAVCREENLPAFAKLMEREIIRYQRGDQTARQILTQAITTLGKHKTSVSSGILVRFLTLNYDATLTQHVISTLHEVGQPEAATDLIKLHRESTDITIRQQLEGLLKNGTFDIHWNDSSKTFGLGSPKVEAE